MRASFAVVVVVEGKIVPDVSVLKGFTAPFKFGAAHDPNDLVSERLKFPLEVCVTTPSTRILYLPLPYWQQIPSPQLSKIVKMYEPAGTFFLAENHVRFEV